ncbi:MAG: HlyD family efflux transporter periplasmic adaptor subunit, partial [Methylocella sp.]
MISTILVSLRTPIEGTVTGLPNRVGAMVARGALIAHIENPRVNDEHLVDLREHQTRTAADLKGAEANRAALLNLQTDLLRRAAIHTKVNSERLASVVEEAEKVMAALAAKQAQAQNDVDRRLPLEASGIVTKVEMHKLRSTLEAARQDVAAQAARVAALRTEAKAAAQGVLTGNTGGTDKSYSAQRADEIAIEVSTLNKTISTLTAEANETKARLSAEQHRIDLLRSADIVAPSAGMIWKLGAADGERLGIGDMAAEIVDCTAPFLLAAIPQNRFSDVEIAGVVQFRLSGERTEHTGTLASVTGHGDLAQGEHYAVMPLDEPSTVIATVAMPRTESGAQENSTHGCLIGRPARADVAEFHARVAEQFMLNAEGPRQHLRRNMVWNQRPGSRPCGSLRRRWNVDLQQPAELQETLPCG